MQSTPIAIHSCSSRIKLCFTLWFILIIGAMGNILAIAQSTKGKATLTLENEKVKCSVVTENNQLLSDKLEVQPVWAKQCGAKSGAAIETDADFALDLMYTDWSAPGKMNCADNPIMLGKKDFTLVHQSSSDTGGVKELSLYFKAKETTLELLMIYRLEQDDFYVRRSIAVMDTAFGHHFLRWMWARKGNVSGISSVVKAGDFGQPVAVTLKQGGAFFGLEYPTSENRLDNFKKPNAKIRCGQEIGQIIDGAWFQGEWVVEAITPNSYVKDWFSKYIDDIRVVPLKPYTLYNSWYDLRSPEYPKVPAEHVMSEESAMKMAKLLRENMIEKHNIALDAFVLDDGWDIYESDWTVRKEQWSHGFKPLADELKKTNTSLGIWFGPTGGYSFRMKRVNWMKEHGYEVVGKTRDNAMLCLAGMKYNDLFRKRVTDFVANDGIAYFKWDGIQFSCSEPTHGHPIDIYSRRAVMESVIDKCNSVRQKNPDVFLNISSGTWLSPWWVKYANTIWMQGSDYGYSDVPSISRRDGAITYRDFILYDDFKNLDLWFPIANLMTHGIIKGKLQLLGTAEEPLDKFTDDVLLYFARGVAMYELYISPNILSEGEWRTMSSAITWAKDRFPILTSSTYMIGGNPMKRETYGYVHYRGNKGIVAVRNPFILSNKIDVELSVAQGLDPAASSLVIEKIYPTHWVAPKLYKAGEKITLPLEGYETAVYEVYPVSEATVPLVGGVMYDVVAQSGNDYMIGMYGASPGKLLNPSMVQSIQVAGKPVAVPAFNVPPVKSSAVVSGNSVTQQPGKSGSFSVKYTLSKTASEAQIAILLTPDTSLVIKNKPSLIVTVDGDTAKVTTDDQEGKSQWYIFAAGAGKRVANVQLNPGKDEKSWNGKAVVYLIAQQKQNTVQAQFTLTNSPATPRPLPAKVWKNGEIRKNVKLGEVVISRQ